MYDGKMQFMREIRLAMWIKAVLHILLNLRHSTERNPWRHFLLLIITINFLAYSLISKFSDIEICGSTYFHRFGALTGWHCVSFSLPPHLLVSCLSCPVSPPPKQQQILAQSPTNHIINLLIHK